MHIGIAFDLKPDAPLPEDAPDDLYEEFDSPETIDGLANAIRATGHEVTLLGNGRAFVESLLRNPPDLVFNFAEGTGVSRCREARVPAVCEMLGIPYTGSDALAMSVALDKDMTRRVVESAGVTVPRGLTLSFDSTRYDGDFAEFPAMLEASELTLPVIAKPTYEGSSKGVRNCCLIRHVADFGPTVVQLWQEYRQPILVEEFIDGLEVTVGIIGNDPPQVLGAMAILPRTPGEKFVYSLEVKRDYRNRVEYTLPNMLPLNVLRDLEAAALTVYQTIGCRDLARADFRILHGVPYFLEINPLPGLNPINSDLVILSGKMNISYEELIAKIVQTALQRTGLAS